MTNAIFTVMGGIGLIIVGYVIGRSDERLYTTPPQRTWEGLSVFEINDLVENTEYEDYRSLVERTESKLKGKNT